MFTTEELQLIIQLADLALRTQGLQAANAVMPLAAKCQSLLSQPIAVSVDPQPAQETIG